MAQSPAAAERDPLGLLKATRQHVANPQFNESDADARTWQAWQRFSKRFPQAASRVRGIRTDAGQDSKKLSGQITTDGFVELNPNQSDDDLERTIAHEVAHILGQGESESQAIERAYSSSMAQASSATQAQHYDKDGNPVRASYDKDGNVVVDAPKSAQPASWLQTAKEVIQAIPGIPHPDDLKVLAGWLPAVGGGIGGVVAGPAGAAIGGAAGEGMRQTALHASEIPGAVVDVARNLRTQPAATVMGGIEGMRQGAQGAGQAALEQGTMAVVGDKVLNPALRHVGGVLMQSAVKPGMKATAKALGFGVNQEDLPIVKTLLKEGVNVSPGGIAKLNNIIGATNDEIKAAVAGLKGPIYPESAAARAEELLPGYAAQANPVKDVKAVTKSVNEFLDRSRPSGVGPATPMTPVEAQAVKQGTYKSLNETAYGTVRPAKVEAQKAIARGLKEDIAAEAARNGIDLTGKNAQEGAAIQAKEAVARRLAVAGNRDPVALAWLAHNPVAGLAMILERSPAVKSMLARGLYKSAATAARMPENTLRLMLTAIAEGAPDESQP